MKIVFIHLLNDFSGSPLILSQVIAVCNENGFKAELFTGNSGEGFLSDVAARKFTYGYKRFENRYLTLISYLASQVFLFFKLLKYKNQEAIFYINTMLPFGAGLAGKLLGKRVVYHLHETSVTPPVLKFFLRWVVQLSSELNIFVSQYLLRQERFEGIKSACIHNVLPESFIRQSIVHTYEPLQDGRFTVLMLCSLKKYKGIDEFLAIARLLEENQDIRFLLVLNADPGELEHFFADRAVPANVEKHANQTDVVRFYQKASLLLNLSRIDEWVETFGLTILEAMAFGVPCVVPPIGGPVELVEEGRQGFLISSHEVHKIADKIGWLAEHPETCREMAQRAREKASRFSPEDFAQNILRAIDG